LSGGGLVFAAPASGSGKTTLVLGLARALRDRGLTIACAKSGPDYIDPAFHEAASGRPCRNLDRWAMRDETLAGLIAEAGQAQLVLCEGAMGLYDGIDAQGTGSCADLARFAGWPVILIVDARGLAASAGPLVAGFANAVNAPRIAGVIFNRAGGETHANILRETLAIHAPGIAYLGAIPRDAKLNQPERHLGLVQARERDDLDGFIAHAATVAAKHIDLDALTALAIPSKRQGDAATPLPPLGARIAIARDDAFAFAYPTTLDGWRRQGAELSFFAPLDGQRPDAVCNAIYLPGGYPELHAGKLANGPLPQALRDAAARNVAIYGECGGYMVLGRTMIDANGTTHAMASLLPLDTSFAARRLHLGYRRVVSNAETKLGSAGAAFRAHEFHYTAILREGPGESLFTASDARGKALGVMGLRAGSVFGSFAHLIDRDASDS
jgi:cobyrinic acid a,c-diamide synthase